MIQNGCILLLPMSLTMITTAMLNSMGFEKQTLVFYFVGAAAMLLCILFLPALCGAYAYLIGLGVSYVFTALCNLIFLFKKCPLYHKRSGKVFLREYLPSLLSVPFLCVFGTLANNLFKQCAGEILSLIFTALALLLVLIPVCLVTGIIPVKSQKTSKKRSKSLT